MFPESLERHLSEAGVIAVLVIDDADHAIPLTHALLEGGVTAMELTLRTPAAMEALSRILEVPEMTAGVGTILTPEQVSKVSSAGAAFGVAPGLNPRVIEQADRLGFPFAPGIVTPSELEKAVEMGCRTLKFFPAEAAGGMSYLKSMGGPYQHLGLRYIPLGGLNLNNAQTYLESPLVSAIGGSWIARRKMIRNQAWKTITRNASDCMEIIKQVRGA
ncbi:bifunctional 4-hydroxy-2-oxoglutarate aldolase/2-dehydro-3-deoxy-phosphogluconate aldolase [candidate division KSB1 bacterium]|nr:bifunctional 4-hydroxy-2-oxoglutarate aldolase/2-dehydro-3-deoxy-phosphogluconate aldolase [candidate division KSB1 bacterium]